MRFQKKKVTEAIANPEGIGNKKSPRITQRQKDTTEKQVEIKRKQYGMGEEMEPQTQNQISARNLELRAEKMRVAADQQAMQQKKKKLQTQQKDQSPMTSRFD